MNKRETRNWISKNKEWLAKLFAERNWRWRDDRTPTANEIRQTYLRLMKHLNDNEDSRMYETGRIRIEEDSGHYDVYIAIN